jgi:hypothetical protein
MGVPCCAGVILTLRAAAGVLCVEVLASLAELAVAALVELAEHLF